MRPVDKISRVLVYRYSTLSLCSCNKNTYTSSLDVPKLKPSLASGPESAAAAPPEKERACDKGQADAEPEDKAKGFGNLGAMCYRADQRGCGGRRGRGCGGERDKGRECH